MAFRRVSSGKARIHRRHYLAERVGEVKRLKERVQVTCSALVLKAHISGFLLRIIVVEVVPEDAGLILYNPDICTDVCRIVLNERSVGIFPSHVEHPAHFEESREAPVALLLCEPVVGRVLVVYRRVVGVPQNEGELDAAAPVLGNVVGLEAMLEVD